MSLIVHKYGGTSVGSIERIEKAADRVASYFKKGHQMVVACSAMSGETDRLLGLADAIDKSGSPRERDMLASVGEQVTIGLMAIALHKRDVPAISFTGPQVGIRTDAVHTKARITSIDGGVIRKNLNEGKVVVVAGFQGLSPDGEITTLGRGASDLTAVALAAVLKADLCEIYTDVDGVYAADPNIVPKVRRLSQVSFDEMLEMASAGAKVLQGRSVEFAKKYDVPIKVLSSFVDGPGTLVSKEVPEMEAVVVSAVTHNRKEAKVSILGVPDVPGVAANLFGTVADNNVVVDMIIQNVGSDGRNDISFTVEKSDLPMVMKLRPQICDGLGARDMITNEAIAKVSVIGVGMRSHAGVAARMFRALAAKGINIQMISTSEIKISCVIEEAYTELAVRVLCEEFGLVEEAQ